MRSFSVKLVNDNGHVTGAGTMTLTIKAKDRAAAQVIALQYVGDPKRVSPESKWRLHDNEPHLGPRLPIPPAPAAAGV